MIPHWMMRTRLLLGDEQIEKLMQSHVLVAGLGGVGGICAEMIARAGVGEVTLIDADTVDPTNRNRQVPALHTTEGKLKTEVMAARLREINPDIKINVYSVFVEEHNRNQILSAAKYDYICDCIDTLSPKVNFIKDAMEMNINIVSSMGAGGRVDPTKIKIADLSKSYNCPLAQEVRRKLRYMGIKHGLKVVFSHEHTDKSRLIRTPEEMKKKSIIGTISYLPAAFGICVASVAIRGILEPSEGVE